MSSVWPGSTYASSKGAQIRYKMSAYKRNKYIAKKRAAFQPPIQRAIYGKSFTVKLSKYTNATTDGFNVWQTVYPLVNLLQSTNDWASYASSNSLFNILQVTVHVFPQAQGVSQGHDSMGVICYDPKDTAAALGSYGSGSDHLQFKAFNCGVNSSNELVFSFKPKPGVHVPISTALGTEAYGAVKGYANDTTFGALKSIFVLIFTFTVAFTSQE